MEAIATAGTAGRPDAERDADLARYYDLDAIDLLDDLPLFLELAAADRGPILELAAGSGRLAIPLALAGHDVVGLDNDPAMLARAAATWDDRDDGAGGSFDTVVGDMRSYRAERGFGSVLIALNTLLLMPDDDARLAVLGAAAANLRPGGRLIVDVLDHDAPELETYDGRLQLEWVRTDPETGEDVTKLISARHEPDHATVTLTQIFDATPPGGGPVRRRTRTDVLHLISGARWVELVERAGFADVELKGDHRLMPHGAGSHRALILARAL